MFGFFTKICYRYFFITRSEIYYGLLLLTTSFFQYPFHSYWLFAFGCLLIFIVIISAVLSFFGLFQQFTRWYHPQLPIIFECGIDKLLISQYLQNQRPNQNSDCFYGYLSFEFASILKIFRQYYLLGQVQSSFYISTSMDVQQFILLPSSQQLNYLEAPNLKFSLDKSIPFTYQLVSLLIIFEISITSAKLLSQQYHNSLNPQYISNMDNFKNYLHKIKNAIYQNAQQTINNLKQALASDKIGKNETNLNISQVSLQQRQLQQQSRIIDQKVLEIDVIQSGYIPKTQENIAPLTLSKHQVQLSARSRENERQKSNPSPSRLRNIEQQKKAILQELKEIDSEIAEIKGENVIDVTVKRKEKEEESEQAKKKAKELVRQLKVQKKQLQQKKRKEAQKSLLAFKQQEEDFKKKREEQLFRAKQERRKAIQSRMQEQRRKRQQRKLIDKESNKLIKQLKKEEQIIKLKEELPHEVSQLQLKKKFIIKKSDVNFRQIQDHERRYMIMKEQERSAKKQRAESVDHHVPRYPKNMWIQQIQEQEFKRREEEKIKEALKKIQLQKRKKYGELVKNIFIPKMKKQTFTQQMNDKNQEKPHTPEVVMLPKIAQSDKRVTDSKPMRKFMEQNRPFATAHHKPPKPQQIKKKQKQPQDEQRERQKKMKQAELRRQTKQRLKKLENKSLQILPKSKPKYENYLGQIKSKLGNEAQSWKKVIENDNLSKEQKYKQMVRRAQALQNKAKVKEQMRKNGDQDALNLYIGSIQAKLAILQKF